VVANSNAPAAAAALHNNNNDDADDAPPPPPPATDGEYLSFLDTATLVAIVAQKQREADGHAAAPPAAAAAAGDDNSDENKNKMNNHCVADSAKRGQEEDDDDDGTYFLFRGDPLALTVCQGPRYSGDSDDDGCAADDDDDAFVVVAGGEGDEDDGSFGGGGADEAAYSRCEIEAEALRSRLASGAARIAEKRGFLCNLMKQHERSVRAQVLGTERVLQCGGALEAARPAEASAAGAREAVACLAIAVATTILACGAALCARAAAYYIMGRLA